MAISTPTQYHPPRSSVLVSASEITSPSSPSESRSRASTTASNTSQNGATSPRTSFSSIRTSSGGSIPRPSGSARSTHERPPSFSEHLAKRNSVDGLEGGGAEETLSDMERERRRRKSDYAIQISQIMGKQLMRNLRESQHDTDVLEEALARRC